MRSHGALVAAPTEQDHGRRPAHLYYHVPSAWTAFILFVINFGASGLISDQAQTKADLVALVSAEVGVVFCTVVLVTGPIWARPVWGIWWTWDMRLTSTLVLWLIYVSYLVWRRFPAAGRRSLAGSRLGGSWRPRCVPCVYFDLVFPHPAPAAGHGRRRID